MAKKFPWTASVLALAVSSAFAQSAPQTTQQSSNPYQFAYLDPVVVTANRYEEEYRVIPAYVTYISRKDIEESNVQTVNEAIIRLGGLVGRASLYGGREQNIDIMGFGDAAQSNTVILLDGMPLNEADMSEVRISGIPVESVEAIEIHRSSASVLYGGGANGGVINIITKMSQGDNATGFSGSIYGGAGSFNSQEYRVTARHAASGFSLFFSGAHLISDGYRQNSSSREKTGVFSARYSTGPALFGFSASSDDQRVRTPGPLREEEFRINARAAQPLSLEYKTYNDIQQQKVAAFAEVDVGFAILRADGYARSRDVDALAIQFESPVGLRFSGDSSFASLSIRKPYESSRLKNQLLIGYEDTSWSQERRYVRAFESIYGNRDTLNSSSKSYFLKNDLDLKEIHTRISFGYRSEENRKSYQYETGLSPYFQDFKAHAMEFGVSRQLDRLTTVFARTAKSYRFANLDDIPGSYALDPYRVVVLRPQTSSDIEIGIKHSTQSGGRLQGRVYQSRLVDEISYNVLEFVTMNLDKTRRKGLDFDGSAPLTKSIRVNGGLSVRNAEFVNGSYSGKEIPMSLPKTALVGVSWQPIASHRLGFDAQWVGSQHPAGDNDNRYRVPSYWVANFRYDYRLGAIDFSATVRNLFDRSYYSYATIVAKDYPGVFDYLGVYPDNGRSVWASVRYRFN